MRRHNIHTPCASIRSRPPRAFTAVEALVAATILAILTAAVSGALMAGRAQSQLARDTLSASFLAQSLLDEVLRLPCSSTGPDNMSTRATYDCVNDYATYADGPGNVPDSFNKTHPLSDLAGNAYPDVYQGFTRSVSMTAVSTSPAGWNRTLTGLLVTVSVSRNGAELVRLQRIAWQ